MDNQTKAVDETKRDIGRLVKEVRTVTANVIGWVAGNLRPGADDPTVLTAAGRRARARVPEGAGPAQGQAVGQVESAARGRPAGGVLPVVRQRLSPLGFRILNPDDRCTPPPARRYQTTLGLHQSFLSIRSIAKEGPNEVHMTYDLPADDPEGVTLVLVIQPSASGRQRGTLLNATVRPCSCRRRCSPSTLTTESPFFSADSCSDIDISQAVAGAVPANDVPRLVGDVLLLLRSSA
jgi:hypothetical protein